MPLVTIAEAIRLTGKSRATIYRKIKAGELTAVKQHASEEAKLDQEQLSAVFGVLSEREMASIQGEAPVMTAYDALMEKMQSLEALLAEKDRRLEDLEEHYTARLIDKERLIISLESQVRLLPHLVNHLPTHGSNDGVIVAQGGEVNPPRQGQEPVDVTPQEGLSDAARASLSSLRKRQEEALAKKSTRKRPSE